MNSKQRLQFKALTVLAAMTAGWLYLAEIFEAEKKIEIAILEDVEPSMISGLYLHTMTHQVALVREGSDWHLETPATELADQEKVQSIVAHLSGMRAQPVENMAPDQANIGLVRLVIDMEGEPPIVLLFGRKSPVSDGRYLSLDSVVHLTTTPLPAALLNSDADLRSPTAIGGGADAHSIQNSGLHISEPKLTPTDENGPHQ